MPTLLNKTLRLFLESIGRRDEYEFYLDKFTKDPTPAFALICPERIGFEEMASVFRFDLNSLLKLQLHPAILLAGESAEAMRDLLLNGNHPYVARTFSGAQGVTEFLDACAAAGRLGVLVMPQADLENALLALIPSVARRIHLIRVRGQLLATEGTRLNYIFTNRANPELVSEDQPIAELACRIFDNRPGTHISICSPWSLLQELFTVRGAGSIIRKASDIRRILDLSQIDRGAILALLEKSFGRRPRAETILANCAEIYLETAMRGALMIEHHPAGAYISKFAVGTEARGEGLASDLWDCLRQDHPAVFWRARRDNPVNQWYDKRADGLHSEGRWRIYWSGVQTAVIPDIITFCLSRPEDFLPEDTPADAKIQA